MAKEAKTKPDSASVGSYLDAVASEALRADGKTIVDLFSRLTGEPPVMWGPSIIGFGAYAYTYDSGHSGTAPRLGLSLRKTGPVIYLIPGMTGLDDRLAALGPHKTGKSCLYLKSLKGIDMAVLEEIARQSIRQMAERYPER